MRNGEEKKERDQYKSFLDKKAVVGGASKAILSNLLLWTVTEESKRVGKGKRQCRRRKVGAQN